MDRMSDARDRMRPVSRVSIARLNFYILGLRNEIERLF